MSKTQTLSESCSAPAFPATSAIRIPMPTSITSSRCARMDCGAPARPRSIWQTLLPAAMTDFWEFNLNPWDTAAGVLLVREAGGTVTRFDGSPFLLNSKEVLASNGIIHQELMDNFAEIFAGRGLEEIPSPVEYAKGQH